MEKNNLEKQNTLLQILLVLLLIPMVSVASIMGYRYLVPDKPVPQQIAVAGNHPNQGQPQQPSPNTGQTKLSNSQNKVLNQGVNPLKSEAEKFSAGLWELIAQTGANYSREYSAPRPENGNFVGEIKDETGVVFAKYTIMPGKKMIHEIIVSNPMNNAGEIKSYSYEFRNRDRSLIVTSDVTGQPSNPWNRK